MSQSVPNQHQTTRQESERPPNDRKSDATREAPVEVVSLETPDSMDETGDPTLPMDTVFSLLSVERRRRTLAYLRRTTGGTTLSELATRIAALENQLPVDHVSSDQRKRVYIALYQSHLPKLDDADVIEYDDNRGTIELSRNAPILYPFLDLALERDIEEASTIGQVRRRITTWLAD